jgi:tRNA(Ile)-lysidine synthase
MNQSANFINAISWPPDGHYVVAVSGGVDSVVLLHLLATHWLSEAGPAASSKVGPRRLQVAYFDHGIRSDTHLDRRLVNDIAAIHGLAFHTGFGRLTSHSEDAQRRARYQFLAGVATSTGADAIITAHHLDDRQETSVLNVLRGTHRLGMAPMSQQPSSEREHRLIRPLLHVPKADLVSYAKHYRLPWREDSTNADLTLARNFVRRELLPLARQLAPNFDNHYLTGIHAGDRLNQAIDRQYSGWLRRHAIARSGEIVLAKLPLWELPHSSLLGLLATAVLRLSPGSALTTKNLEQLARLTKTSPVGSQKTLPGGLRAIVGYDTVTLVSGEPASTQLPPEQVLAPGLSLRFGRFQLSCGYLGRHLPGAITVRAQGLRVRPYQPGDRIAPLGISGTKKLQDLFTDHKVARAERLSYPVVTSYNGKVVWVPGLAASREFTAPAADPSAHCLTYSLI